MIRFYNSLRDGNRSDGDAPYYDESLNGPRSIHFSYQNPEEPVYIPKTRSFDDVTKKSSSNPSDYIEFESSSSSDTEENQTTEAQTEKSPFEMILSYRDEPDGTRSYFVKYKDRPYRDCRWISAEQYLQYPNSAQSLKRYHKKVLYPPPEPYYDASYEEVERLITCDESTNPPKYLVKWMSLGYDSCTWETDVEEKLVEAFKERNIKKHGDEPFEYPDPDSYQKMETPPKYKGNLELFPYQFEGLNWLVYCLYKRQNCILADEMGLGKTVQAVAYLDYCNRYLKMHGPYLVIAPLATLAHWSRTVTLWTNMNAVVYMSNKKAREIIRQYEFFYPDGTGPKFDVLITSYEIINNDTETFSQFKYTNLIIDEAHRLKNANSKILQALHQIESEHRILLTGTPLQNTIEELQSLLEFLHPGSFSDLATSANSVDGVKALRKRLKPHLLRRLKVDVDQTIAPKEETIIECTMTKQQKQFYRAILEMNAGFLSKGANLQNIAMELRKVCIHPYLINGAEDKILAERFSEPPTPLDLLDCLIRSSGKMILIDKLLPKLKAEGHRVLIFSQMTRLLDILQDYLNSVDHKFLRIDGSVRGTIRQQLIDQFNAEGSDVFIFLLCTKAGGLGINLNAADTVIIFDSDWNPQNDLQAQARCHRIGQTKLVKVYRLITKDTYEERMFEIASKKLGLGHAVLDKDKSKEIDLLLRKGAYHMLNDMEEENFCEENIDQILSRSKVLVFNEAAGSTFSKANFDVEDEDNEVDYKDPDFWQKMLPQQEQPVEEEPTSDDGYMRTRHRNQQSLNEEELAADDDGQHEWKRSEREKLQHLLSWFGWGRWEDAQRLCGLRRPVIQVKLAARAFLRKLLYNNDDLSQFSTARILLEQAITPEFDPSFVNSDDADAVDADFMRQAAFIDPEFIQSMNNKGSAWLKRIETLYYINLALEKAEYKFEEIKVPACQGNLPAEWWTLDDDRCLIYGTWKCGFAKYDDFIQDESISFTCKKTEGLELPPSTNLTPRLKKLSAGLKKIFCSDGKSNIKLPTDVNRPKNSLWKKRDKSVILQQMLHAGVPLKPDGEYDWTTFRETCGFPEKTDEQIEKFVEEMMNSVEDKEDNDEKSEDNKEEKEKEPKEPIVKEEELKSQDEKAEGEKDGKSEEKEGKEKDSASAITAGRVKQRFQSLTRLRKLFLKFPEEDLQEFFNYLPRWRNVPRAWTNAMEFIFFKEINIRGWGVCGEILKLPTFDGVFEGEPPQFVTSDARVMRRLESIMKYIEENSLEALREKEAVKPKRKPTPSTDVYTIPTNLSFDEEGKPVLPIKLTSTFYVISLGEIVTDRTAFHTERYIYPAGFKSSRLYTSTLDPNKKVRYTCEILDVGDPCPLFRVTMDERPDIFYEGNSPTTPWNIILKLVKELRTENKQRALSISGPDYFGLAAHPIIYLIQKMKGAEKCVNYQFRNFVPASEAPPEIKPARERKPHVVAEEKKPKPILPLSNGVQPPLQRPPFNAQILGEHLQFNQANFPQYQNILPQQMIPGQMPVNFQRFAHMLNNAQMIQQQWPIGNQNAQAHQQQGNVQQQVQAQSHPIAHINNPQVQQMPNPMQIIMPQQQPKIQISPTPQHIKPLPNIIHMQDAKQIQLPPMQQPQLLSQPQQTQQPQQIQQQQQPQIPIQPQ